MHALTMFMKLSYYADTKYMKRMILFTQ